MSLTLLRRHWMFKLMIIRRRELFQLRKRLLISSCLYNCIVMLCVYILHCKLREMIAQFVLRDLKKPLNVELLPAFIYFTPSVSWVGSWNIQHVLVVVTPATERELYGNCNRNKLIPTFSAFSSPNQKIICLHPLGRRNCSAIQIVKIMIWKISFLSKMNSSWPNKKTNIKAILVMIIIKIIINQAKNIFIELSPTNIKVTMTLF